MEAELEKILENSPWNKTEIENWRNILNAGQFGEFILKADAEAIATYNQTCSEEYRIQTNLLPQPFIGTPEAPIWILNQNPGYCEIDHYDMLGEKTEIQEWMNKNNITLRPETEDEYSLKKRQKMILDQLTFETPIDFYILDDDFDTIEYEGQKLFGGYNWWNKKLLQENLCNGDKKMLSNFFVLEFFPYHSEKFGQKLSNTEVVHSKVWKELVSYALKSKKLLICRGEKIIKEIQTFPDFAGNSKRVLRFSSPQNVTVSKNNLISLEDYARSKRTDDAKKKHAAKLVYAALNKKSE